jgi:hypothetical protein
MQLLKNKKNPDILDEAFDKAPQEDSKDRIVFFGVLILFGIGALTLLSTIFTAFLLFKAPPSLVRDTRTNEAFQVTPSDPNAREPNEIQAFLVDRIRKLHNWTGTIPSKRTPGLLEKDPGMNISGKSTTRKIPTPVYEASFSLAEAIRIPVLEKISTQVPQDIFKNDPTNMLANKYVLLSERYWGQPKQIAKGRWETLLIADINLFNPEFPQGKRIGRFNKRLFVSTLPSVPLLVKENPFEFLAYANRKERLVIDSILEYDRGGNVNVPR